MDFYKPKLKKVASDDFAPIPVAEAQETDWADWEDSVAFQDQQPAAFRITEKMPLIAEESDYQDAFESVTRKRG